MTIPRSPVVAPADHVNLVDDDMDVVSQEMAQRQPQQAAETPLETWRKKLAELKIEESTAQQILDDVFQKGYYEAPVKLLRGRVTVRLRTRDQTTLRRISDELDQLRTNDPRVHGEVMQRHILIDSLAAFGDETFEFPTPTTVEAKALEMRARRASKLSRMNGALYEALARALQRFDQVTYAVLDDGDVQGF